MRFHDAGATAAGSTDPGTCRRLHDTPECRPPPVRPSGTRRLRPSGTVDKAPSAFRGPEVVPCYPGTTFSTGQACGE